MARFIEVIQTRAPAGTVSALEDLARAENKRPGDIVREAILTRLNSAKAIDREAA